jgi:hypothetical protein
MQYLKSFFVAQEEEAKQPKAPLVTDPVAKFMPPALQE